MAKLYITEFSKMGSEWAGSHKMPAAIVPPIVDQDPLAIGVASAQSNAFNGETRVVRLHCDAICSVAFGINPTATTDNARLAEGQTEYFSVVPGHCVAVIENT